MWPTLLFAAALVLVSAALLLWHLQDWRVARAGTLSGAEETYQRERFRRRLLASSLLGVIGLVTAVTEWIVDPLFLLCLWLTVLALLGWSVSIAAADWSATRRHYSQLRQEQLAEHAALQAEAERLKRQQSRRGANGH